VSKETWLVPNPDWVQFVGLACALQRETADQEESPPPHTLMNPGAKRERALARAREKAERLGESTHESASPSEASDPPDVGNTGGGEGRMIRVSFCLNAGPRAGFVQAAALSKPAADELLKVAGNKLRLKKGEVARARLFVWGSGRELAQGVAANLLNDTIIAVSLGEDYAGSVAAGGAGAADCDVGDEGCDARREAAEAHARNEGAVAAPAVCGRDDTGRFFASLDELWAEQRAQRRAFYAANSAWWEDGGYNGSTDEAAMIGDEHSEADIEESRRFLDGLLVRQGLRVASALDAGAGVGRSIYIFLLKCVTKHLLFCRCNELNFSFKSNFHFCYYFFIK
jgi:hypothetical protein